MAVRYSWPSTPTQIPLTQVFGDARPFDPSEPPNNTFSVYHVYLEAGRDSLAVTRSVHTFDAGSRTYVLGADDGDEPIARRLPL